MNKRNKNHLQSAVITGGTLLGAYLIQKGLEEIWEKSTGKETPKNLYESNNSLKEVLAWTVATGVIASVAKVFLKWTFSAASNKVIDN
jgi:hypothetical protein